MRRMSAHVATKACLAGLCVLLGAATAPAGPGPKSRADDVLLHHDDWWRRWIVVGIVTPDDSGVFSYTRDGYLPPQANTAFRVGSITKTFTATLLALQDGTREMSVGRCPGPHGRKGRQALLEPALAKACPTCGKKPKTALLHKSRQGITIEQLATHRSGLAHKPTLPVCNTADLYATLTVLDVDTAAHKGCDTGTDPFAREEIERQPGCQARYLCFAPDDRFNYSNWGYDLLGPLVAFNAGYGDDYNRLVRERLLLPLGMTHTFSNDETPLPLGQIEKAPSWDCTSGPCQSKVSSSDAETFHQHGSGNMWSTGDDMLIYLRFVMGRLRLPTSAAALDATRTLVFCDRAQGETGEDGTAAQIGLAWNHEAIGATYDAANPGDLIWNKAGSAGDFHAYIAFSRKKGVGVFVLGNTSEDDPSKIGRTIIGGY